MEPDIEIVEQRLKSFLVQLQTEYRILDRIVYKNKNQHRRCSYFQFLLKVRRDLRLLQSANLEEILNATFIVISGNRPRQKVQVLESLKRRKGYGGKYNLLERLLGVARLLAQMIEPMLRGATEISVLLAQSFFMRFSLTILSLLARLRVLVQQMLLDIVLAFNTVSSMTKKEQAVKLNQQGFEVYREYFPIKEQVITTLECVWQTDKFLLIEKMNEAETKSQGENSLKDFSAAAPIIQYESFEVSLGDGESTMDSNHTSGEHSTKEGKDQMISSSGLILNHNDKKQVEEPEASFEKIFQIEGGLSRNSEFAPNPLKRKSASKEKVAFISIKKPAPAQIDSGFGLKVPEKGEGDEEDPLINLFNDENTKRSIF
ncbi:hypothetical protein LIER_12795 [Lithospermum erythrorhizon]|uniref:Nucleolus and neural progenitor protein-like N-terminal domain-containing protein n=1 Tax=Lithospermum erythrorhizon TaxID=34254 RepID=A0AAV3PUJ0_LITER